MTANLVFEPDVQAAMAQVKHEPDFWKSRLMEWCSINTGSRNLAGLQSFLPLLETAFSTLPGALNRRPLAPEKIINAQGKLEDQTLCDALHLVVRPEAPIKLVLTGHYDTVFPAGTSFVNVQEIQPGIVNGPGVADMKGGLLVMLDALRLFETLDCAQGVGYEVLLSPDEEIGSPGSAALLAQIGARSDVGLTYEPALADGSMSGARKGSGNFSLTMHGKAAHVGRAHHEGRSAIAAAARFVVGLEALNGTHPGVTFNTGRIDGGGPNNVVPDLAIVRFNVRVPDDSAAQWASQQIEGIRKQIVRENDLHTHLHGGFNRPPKPRTPAQALMFEQVATAGRAVGLDLVYTDTGGVCEGNNLAASGCANVDTLGPRGGLIHSDQEFAVLDSFPERVKLSLALLVGYATGQLDAKAPRRLLAQTSELNAC